MQSSFLIQSNLHFTVLVQEVPSSVLDHLKAFDDIKAFDHLKAFDHIEAVKEKPDV